MSGQVAVASILLADTVTSQVWNLSVLPNGTLQITAQEGRTQAASRVQRQWTDSAKPARILSREWWQIGRPQYWQGHMPAMGVPGELQIDTITCRDIGVVRLMGQQQCAVPCRNSSQRLVEIRTASEYAVNPAIQRRAPARST